MQFDDSGSGVTSESLAFFRQHRGQLQHVTEIVVRFPAVGDPTDPYLLVLRDVQGNTMRLSGCTAGYDGEGPRATFAILQELGFPAVDARRVLSEGHVEPPRDACRL